MRPLVGRAPGHSGLSVGRAERLRHPPPAGRSCPRICLRLAGRRHPGTHTHPQAGLPGADRRMNTFLRTVAARDLATDAPSAVRPRLRSRFEPAPDTPALWLSVAPVLTRSSTVLPGPEDRPATAAPADAGSPARPSGPGRPADQAHFGQVTPSGQAAPDRAPPADRVSPAGPVETRRQLAPPPGGAPSGPAGTPAGSGESASAARPGADAAVPPAA